MTKLERPFTEEWDAAGHNVVGIRFDTPIPWPVWDGKDPYTAQPVSNMADRIALTLRGEDPDGE